jgi:intracellular sulfur oxidation DsrE/DsrF family protein
MNRKTFVSLILGIASLGFFSPAVLADTAKPGVVIQVSDDSPKTWNQSLNVVKNLQSAYGKDKVDIEVVVFGMGSGMLKLESPLVNRIDEALDSGVKVVMCENTMKGQKLTKDDMHPKIGFVPAGAVEIVEKQKQGWGGIRP